MAKLTFVLEDGQEVVVPLAGLITLGRDDDNDVVIDDECISRHHAELLTHADGRIEVHDLGSTAGTFINARPVRHQFIRQGDTLAFGPLAARIVFEEPSTAPVCGDDAHAESMRVEEARLAQLRADIQEAEAGQTKMVASINELARQHDEKAAAVLQLEAGKSAAQQEQARLRQDCADEENRLGDLRRQLAEVEASCRAAKSRAATHEKQAQAAGSKLEQLGHEQQRAEESLLRVQTELRARENDLAATERQQVELQTTLQQTHAQLAAQDAAMLETGSAEAAAQERRAALAAREKDLRVELETLSSGVEAARDELAGIESRLTPLRDWQKSMDQRYASLATLPKGADEESDLWREIEEAQAALADLLPAARIETHGLGRGDFARISARRGIPMKSDRIRRAGV